MFKKPHYLCYYTMIDNYVGVEILENLAYLANASNLVIYLSDYMHLSPSKSANNVTNFMGTSFLLALLGGFLADTFFTTYHIFLISAAIEFLVIAACSLSLSLSLSLSWVSVKIPINSIATARPQTHIIEIRERCL